MTVHTCLEDITPPRAVREAMEMQAEAERKKRAQILESEGKELNVRFIVQLYVQSEIL